MPLKLKPEFVYILFLKFAVPVLGWTSLPRGLGASSVDSCSSGGRRPALPSASGTAGPGVFGSGVFGGRRPGSGRRQRQGSAPRSRQVLSASLHLDPDPDLVDWLASLCPAPDGSCGTEVTAPSSSPVPGKGSGGHTGSGAGSWRSLEATAPLQLQPATATATNASSLSSMPNTARSLQPPDADTPSTGFTPYDHAILRAYSRIQPSRDGGGGVESGGGAKGSQDQAPQVPATLEAITARLAALEAERLRRSGSISDSGDGVSGGGVNGDVQEPQGLALHGRAPGEGLASRRGGGAAAKLCDLVTEQPVEELLRDFVSTADTAVCALPLEHHTRAQPVIHPRSSLSYRGPYHTAATLVVVVVVIVVVFLMFFFVFFLHLTSTKLNLFKLRNLFLEISISSVLPTSCY